MVGNSSRKYSKALVGAVFFLMSSNFAAGTISIKENFSFRFYCGVSYVFGSSPKKCLQKNKTNEVVTTDNSAVMRLLATKVSAQEGMAQNQLSSNNVVSAIATQPQTVIQYVYLKGEKGDKGDKGDPGLSYLPPNQTSGKQTHVQTFETPLPFWNGSGISNPPTTQTIIQQISGLPVGGSIGQILTINASGTPEWLAVTSSLPVGGSIGQILTINASGTPEWLATSSPTNSIDVINGLTLSTTSTSSLISFGGSFTQSTSINQQSFNFETIRSSVLNSNTTLSLYNGVISVPLSPSILNYSINHSGSFARRNYTIATNIGFGQLALGTSTFRAGLNVGEGEVGTPFFDAYNYIPMSDTTADVHRIYNSNYGPAMYYDKYASSSATLLRSYAQTRNDGGFYAIGSNPPAGTRSEINLYATGALTLRAYDATNQADYSANPSSGITLTHASPGASTILTISASTGVTVSGKLAVGTTSPLATLHVATTSATAVARFDNANGYCEINPTSASLVCTSDRTLKKDIIPLHAILSTYTQLKPVTYHWNPQLDTEVPQYGLIAQDVETLFPSIVYTNPNTQIKTLAYTALIPLTIGAVQELNTALGDLASETATPEVSASSIIFKRILGGLTWMGVRIEKGIANFENLFAKEATIERLCFDGEKTVCLTKDEVLRILQATQVTSVPAPIPSETPQAETPTPTPISDEGETVEIVDITSNTGDEKEVLENIVSENQEEGVVTLPSESLQEEPIVSTEI